MGPGRWAGWLAVAALGGAASCTTPEKPASAPDTGLDNGSPAVPAQKGPATGAGAMVKIPGGTFQMARQRPGARPSGRSTRRRSRPS